MQASGTQTIDIDIDTASLVQALSAEPPQNRGVAALLTAERLRRLEEEARFSGTSRQAFQKVASARRLLGDRAHFGSFNGPFLDD